MITRLKFARLQRGLSQAALARKSGVHQPVICRIETGKWNPSPDDLRRLADALGLDPDIALEPVEIAASAIAERGTR